MHEQPYFRVHICTIEYTYVLECTNVCNQVHICSSRYTYIQSSTYMCDNAYVRVLAKISTQNPDVPDSLTCLTEYAKTIDFRFLNMSFD